MGSDSLASHKGRLSVQERAASQKNKKKQQKLDPEAVKKFKKNNKNNKSDMKSNKSKSAKGSKEDDKTGDETVGATTGEGYSIEVVSRNPSDPEQNKKKTAQVRNWRQRLI